MIYVVLDKWVFNRNRVTEQGEEIDAADLAVYEDILDEEIKKYY